MYVSPFKGCFKPIVTKYYFTKLKVMSKIIMRIPISEIMNK